MCQTILTLEIVYTNSMLATYVGGIMLYYHTYIFQAEY